MRLRAFILIAVLVVLMRIISAAALPASAKAAFPVSDPGDVLSVSGVQVFDTLDYNGDGLVDLLGARGSLGGELTLTLSLSTPSGYAPAQVVTVPGVTGYKKDLAVAELTGDQRDDAVVTLDETGDLVLIRGRADGQLMAPAPGDIYHIVPATTGSLRPTSVDTGDVDGDGDLDVAAAFGTPADSGFPPSTADNGTVSILTNDGTGTLAITGPTLPVNSPVHVLLLPLAGDGDPDLIVAQYNKPPASGLKVFPGATGATFAPPSSYSSGAGPPESLDWGDFNQDGRLDFAVGHSFAAYPNHIAPVDTVDGGAAASLLTPAPVAGSAGTSVAVGDLDRDGHDDLYVAAGEPPVFGARSLPVFLHGNGDGSFGTPLTATAATFPVAIESEYGPVIDDLDGDGWPDVLTRGLYDSGYSLRYGVGPQLVPTPDALDFGSQLVGTASAPQTVTFINTGPGTATNVAVIRDSDADHKDFPLPSDGCSGRTLALGASCDVVVSFAPLAVGDRESLLAAGGQESDTVVLADLLGTGTAPAVGPQPSTAAPAPTPRRAKPTVPLRAPRVAAVNRRTLATRGLRFRQRFERAGSARWTLDALAAQARAAKAPSATTLGRAARTLRTAGSVTVTLRLSRAGRRFLAGHRTAKLRLRTVFVDRAGRRFALSTPVTLKR